MLLLELDRFKIINDTLGHSVGDQLLCVVAGRLKIGTNFSTWIKPAEMVFSTTQVSHTSRHTLLFSRINATVRTVGLNPYLGFLHSPQDNYESLVCDIEELFRARIDRFIIRLINLKVVARDDFIEAERGLYLKKDTVKKFIDQFEAEMEKKSPKDTLSLKEDIYVQTIVVKKWVLENGSLSFYRWEI